MTVVLQPTEPRAAGFRAAIEAIWNAACGPALPIAPDLVEFNTEMIPGVAQAGCLALSDARPAGFVLASAVVDGLAVANGWVDAIAVLPEFQEQGIGSALLGWAEAWLAAHGCGRARLGGSLRPFAAGLPVELETAAFFHRRGYVTTSDVWDVARRLSDYATPGWVRTDIANIEPLRAGQEAALLAFLRRAFPGRWEWERRQFLRSGGRTSDVLALWDGADVAGFCQVVFEDSIQPLGRYYMQELPRPWGQLGPIGIGQERRGRGYGAALLDAGLRYLRERGVDGCVIDWTSLLDFYGKFGFRPYRQYAVLVKQLAADAPFS